MSYISMKARDNLRVITREILDRSQFGRRGGRANTRAAARWVASQLSSYGARQVLRARIGDLITPEHSAWDRSPSAVERNRRLLERVAYGQSARLQSGVFFRLALLLECFERGAFARCVRTSDAWDDPEALKYWKVGRWIDKTADGLGEATPLMTMAETGSRQRLLAQFDEIAAKLLPSGPLPEPPNPSAADWSRH